MLYAADGFPTASQNCLDMFLVRITIELAAFVGYQNEQRVVSSLSGE